VLQSPYERIPDDGVSFHKISGGAERDRTVDLSNAIYIHGPLPFSILLATVRCHLKIPLSKTILFHGVSDSFLSSGAQKKHRPPPLGGGRR